MEEGEEEKVERIREQPQSQQQQQQQRRRGGRGGRGERTRMERRRCSSEGCRAFLNIYAGFIRFCLSIQAPLLTQIRLFEG